MELSFSRPDGPTVDLHWSLTPPRLPRLLDFDSLLQRSVSVFLDRYPARVFSPEDTLLYLLFPCLRHQGRSIAWLCDFSQVIHTTPEIRWEEIAAYAASRRYTRVLRLAATLAAGLFEAPVPRELLDPPQSIGPVKSLAFARDAGDEPVWALRRTQSRLLETPADKLRFWAVLFLSPAVEEWRLVPLPRPLFFLYYLLRPLRLLARYVFRRG
jgi:hypothetical protein